LPWRDDPHFRRIAFQFQRNVPLSSTTRLSCSGTRLDGASGRWTLAGCGREAGERTSCSRTTVSYTRQRFRSDGRHFRSSGQRFVPADHASVAPRRHRCRTNGRRSTTQRASRRIKTTFFTLSIYSKTKKGISRKRDFLPSCAPALASPQDALRDELLAESRQLRNCASILFLPGYRTTSAGACQSSRRACDRVRNRAERRR
jgi:hypothetical protein